MLKIVEITDKKEWDGFINDFGGHPLQLWGWGELKAKGNWQVRRIFIKNVAKEDHKKEKYSDVVAAAQILTRKLPWPLQGFAYVPRGIHTVSEKPEERAKLLEMLVDYCKNSIKPRPVAISIEPDWEDFPEKLLNEKKWRRAKNTILIPRTLILDLKKTEAELLADMTKNNRQIIRKSAEKCTVRELETDEEFAQAFEIYRETAERAGFAIHSEKYYQELKKQLGENSPVYGAFVRVQPESEEQSEESETPQNPEKIIEKLHEQEQLVAFSWIAKSGKTAFELYGGSNDLGRETRANYILKWLVIQQLRNAGVERYDMNGLLNDGISKFKSKFARHENMLAGTFDRPLRKSYWIWNNFLPTAKKIVRKFKK